MQIKSSSILPSTIGINSTWQKQQINYANMDLITYANRYIAIPQDITAKHVTCNIKEERTNMPHHAKHPSSNAI